MAKSEQKEFKENVRKCVSAVLIVSDFTDHINQSISSILDQKECLELYVLCPTRINHKVIKEFTQTIKDPRLHLLHDKSHDIVRLTNDLSSSLKGQYFTFINEKDTITPFSFGASLRQLRKETSCVMVHGIADKIDINYGNRERFKSIKEHDSIINFEDGKSIALATMMIKRTAWILLRGFDETLNSCVELDFAIRAYKAFSGRISFIERMQADISSESVKNMQGDYLLNHIFRHFFVLERHDLNAYNFLKHSLNDCISEISSFDELTTFRESTLKYISNISDEIRENIREKVIKPILFDDKNYKSINLLESQAVSLYQEDGLAADLISCISEQIYSGFYTHAAGPYGMYAILRNEFSTSINYIKELEQSCLIKKGHKFSEGFKKRPFGVNLIGHAFDIFGLGEAMKIIARALVSAEIPLNIIDIPARNGCSRENNFLEHYITTSMADVAPYAFNIICMSPMSHAKWLLDKGLDLSIGRYSIGAWFWETSTWPTPWQKLLQFTDGAWAFSSLIHEALLPHCKKNDVLLESVQFPAEIDTDEVPVHANSKCNYRSKFNLPEDAVIFIFGFDHKSQIDRKNPLACIRVFQDAFGDVLSPDYKTDVCLVIKTFKPNKETEEWKNIVRIASTDSRIVLVIDSLKRTEILQLYSCCDIFLSLHRSEGYGLGVAEALQLGLQVIATGYGGNTDFCKGPNAHLVDYQLVPIPSGSYPFSKGHIWAEPNLKHASRICKSVFETIKKKPAKISKPELQGIFSTTKSGKSYRQILDKLYKNLC